MYEYDKSLSTLRGVLHEHITAFNVLLFRDNKGGVEEVCEYEFKFSSDKVFKTCLSHGGMVIVDFPAFVTECDYGTYTKKSCDEELVGRRLDSVYVKYGSFMGGEGLHSVHLLVGDIGVCFTVQTNDHGSPLNITMRKDRVVDESYTEVTKEVT